MAVPDLPSLSGKAVSLVSKDAVWDGKLSCTGDVRVEGRLEGEVETNGTLFVAAEARVQGIVRARSVMLAGEIEGQLRCEERLEILPGGSARGEIDTGALVVHEGAFIESKFQMRREAVQAHA
jgi:cytoskeletal protein CcmA (bactofilin family)